MLFATVTSQQHNRPPLHRRARSKNSVRIGRTVRGAAFVSGVFTLPKQLLIAFDRLVRTCRGMIRMPGKGALLGIRRHLGTFLSGRLFFTVHHHLLRDCQRPFGRFDALALAALFDEAQGCFYQTTYVVKLFERLCARQG